MAGMAQSNDDIAKSRLKLNMRILTPGPPPRPATGPGGGITLKDNKPTYKEKFVPPCVSMISHFMTKVLIILSESWIALCTGCFIIIATR